MTEPPQQVNPLSPPDDPDSDSAGAPATRPKEVGLASRLIIIGGVVGVIASVVFSQTVTARMQQLNPSMAADQAMADTVMRPTIIFVSAISVLILAVCVFGAVMMRSGHNRARIVLTALAALGMLTVPLWAAGLANTGLLMCTVLLVVEMLLVVASVVFMYRPATNTYFSSSNKR